MQARHDPSRPDTYSERLEAVGTMATRLLDGLGELLEESLKVLRSFQA
jgi:hypothetical protein